MKGSFRLLQVAGIDIRIHFTFPLILVWGAFHWMGPYGAAGALFGALLMAALFLCVVLHEMGHALVAKRLGVPVQSIVLLPIGGVALLGRMPRRPTHELLIAAAGPPVNLAIALVLLAVLWTQGGPSLGAAALAGGRPSVQTALVWLLGSNVALAAFNLIPAFPMDGGRILRALLALGLGYPRATRVAAGVGQLVAMAFGVWAISSGNVMLGLVALFVYLGAGGERAAEEARGLLSTLRLKDAYNKYALTLAPGDRASRVVDYLLSSYQPDFAVMHGGRLLGVVTRDAVLRSLGSTGEDVYVASIMDRDFLRLGAEGSLAEAQEAMAEAGRRVAAVFDGDRYLGLISVEDLREALQIAASLRQAGTGRGGHPEGSSLGDGTRAA